MSDSQDPKGYDEAYAELKTILDDLQQDAIGVDELADKVKRAAQLIAFCGARLRKAEGEVQKVLEELGEAD